MDLQLWTLVTVLFFVDFSCAKPAESQKCKWKPEGNPRYLDSKEKMDKENERTPAFCEITLTGDSGVRTRDYSLCTHNKRMYVRDECRCVNKTKYQDKCLEGVNCKTHCGNLMNLCMNGGSLNSDECDENNIKCDCPEGFQGDLCEHVLEQRQCIPTSADSNSETPRRCGEGDIDDCYLTVGTSWFLCSPPEKDSKVVTDIIDSLDYCKEKNETDNDVIETKVDSEWSSWSECKHIEQSSCFCRTKICDTNVDTNCTGFNIEVTNCTVDGNWTSWSEWSSCSETCGKKGERTRVRHCSNPSPRYGGSHCEGTSKETSRCTNNPKCPRTIWSPWSECKHIEQSSCFCRTKICDTNVDTNCTGLNIEVTNCTVDGNWTSWSEWSSCSETCGKNGERTRVRHCSNPSPRYGGSHCEGTSKETSRCTNNPKCPRYYDRSAWSEWKILDSNDTHCHMAKSKYMCKRNVTEERRALACYSKSRVKLCDGDLCRRTSSNSSREIIRSSCRKISIYEMTDLKFPLDYMFGKYISDQGKQRIKCERYKCKREPPDRNYGNCENVYIND